MKYIIMCGGVYPKWDTPKQLIRIKGERIIERTVRLLKENGIDAFISSNDNRFTEFAPLLKHENNFKSEESGFWVDCFYPSDEPCCYLFGDVVYSPEAIKVIITTETDDIVFFASAPPFDKRYIKRWAEPFAFKVRNQKRFRAAIDYVKRNMGLFRRHPISWELWQVLNGENPNIINYKNYVVINDYTCDIDELQDIGKIEKCI